MSKGFKSSLKSNPNPDLSELRKRELPPPSDDKSFIDNPVAALMMDNSNKKETPNLETKITEKADNTIEIDKDESTFLYNHNDKTDFANRQNMVEIMIKSLASTKKLKAFKLKKDKPYYNELKAKCHYLCDYSPDDTFFINIALDALQEIFNKYNSELDQELYKLKEVISSKSKDEEKKYQLETFFLEFIENKLK